MRVGLVLCCLCLFVVLAVSPLCAQDPDFYQYSVRHEKEAPGYFPLQKVEQESVNSAHGNLFSTLPLVSRPGRNGLGVDLKLAYNSKIWDFYVQGSTLYGTVPERDNWVGTGWTLMVARVIDDSTVTARRIGPRRRN